MKYNITRVQLTLELNQLKLLNKLAIKGTVLNPASGICPNITLSSFGVVDGYDMVVRYCREWPEFSGDCGFPVSGWDVYSSGRSLWAGNQLKLRLSLINHIMDCIELELFK